MEGNPEGNLPWDFENGSNFGKVFKLWKFELRCVQFVRVRPEFLMVPKNLFEVPNRRFYCVKNVKRNKVCSLQ